ncbi:Flagellar basal-body rod protein FlgC [Rhodovastum atsumiense]|uniref:Flagellar basal-body rod protein FlgC n=1 Tax=Rhodovastum atsumiense TaxID=504468 RepID=A0A5M6IS41_9PROT|nr:flagellar basal body rod protein FlgC [Rhodovastum atsumiense]KAA5611114.1 flagellar basal body rod protein FlgC [Rhodovastum atsumiense]CAH2599179.1 Flagellar basal-body rod protein FlgC [Rhodovastum atsumiense]
MDMTKALDISSRGMEAQTLRLRVIAENLANQDTTGTDPKTGPYRRKTVVFTNELDRVIGVSTVKVKKIGTDQGELPRHYDPSHPAADAQGYVSTPNVNPFVEMMDMRAAQRAYNANLSVMQVARGMLTRAIELLK